MATKRKVKRYNGEDGSQIDEDYAYDPISKITGEAEIARAKRLEQDKQEAANLGMPEKPSRYQAEPFRAEEKKTVVSKKRGRIVTMKEMKAAGFDNLRDFLNAERGLTRRRSKTESKEKESAEDSKKVSQEFPRKTTIKPNAEYPSKPYPEAEARKKKYDVDRVLEEASELGKNPEVLEALLPAGRLLKGMRGLAARAALKSQSTAQPRREPYMSPNWRNERDITPKPEQLEKPVTRIGMDRPQIAMKKGGAVKSKTYSMPKQSSASKRGDGIAQRGKTKGRIV